MCSKRPLTRIGAQGHNALRARHSALAVSSDSIKRHDGEELRLRQRGAAIDSAAPGQRRGERRCDRSNQRFGDHRLAAVAHMHWVGEVAFAFAAVEDAGEVEEALAIPVTRQAPLQALAVAFLVGVIVKRRR